jgi:uncharacterized protein YcfJ
MKKLILLSLIFSSAVSAKEVTVPEQHCVIVEERSPQLNIGTIIGGITGAVIGNQIGSNGNNAIATYIGTGIGAMIGHDIGNKTRKRQECSTVYKTYKQTEIQNSYTEQKI